MIENDKNQKDKINEELINTYEISYIFENKPLNRLKTKPTLEKKSDRLDQLKRKIEEIDDCELKSNAKSLVLYDGDFNSPVMIVGEGPGEKEDNWFVNLVYAYFFVLLGTLFAPIGYCAVAAGDPTWYYNFMIDLSLLPVRVKGYKLFFN